jgi:GNAT superfamily N-acetyltransferase
MNLKLQRLDLNDMNRDAAQRLLEAAPFYCRNVSGEVANAGDVEEVFKALPDKFIKENKHVLGIFLDDDLVGLIDCLFGYPSPDKAHIGLFLLEESSQGKGLGKCSFGECEKYVGNFSEIKIVRLAVVRKNEVVLPFWEKMVFKHTE